MTVWVFGDSFSVDCNYNKNNHKLYHNKVASSLGHELRNFSIAGSSLDHLYEQFYNQYSNFRNDDYLIITLTVLSRNYFCSTSIAYKQYLLYLENLELKRANLINFLRMLEVIKDQKKLSGIVVLPCFEDVYQVTKEFNFSNLIFANGWLWNISVSELCDQKLLEITQVNDKRLCHMSYINHDILYDRIIDAIKSSSVIDLLSGFKSNIVSIRSYHSIRNDI